MTGPSDAGANVLQKEEAHAVLQSLRQGVLLLRVPVYPAERSAAYFFFVCGGTCGRIPRQSLSGSTKLFSVAARLTASSPDADDEFPVRSSSFICQSNRRTTDTF